MQYSSYSRHCFTNLKKKQIDLIFLMKKGRSGLLKKTSFNMFIVRPIKQKPSFSIVKDNKTKTSSCPKAKISYCSCNLTILHEKRNTLAICRSVSKLCLCLKIKLTCLKWEIHKFVK